VSYSVLMKVFPLVGLIACAAVLIGCETIQQTGNGGTGADGRDPAATTRKRTVWRIGRQSLERAPGPVGERNESDDSVFASGSTSTAEEAQ